MLSVLVVSAGCSVIPCRHMVNLCYSLPPGSRQTALRLPLAAGSMDEHSPRSGCPPPDVRDAAPEDRR